MLENADDMASTGQHELVHTGTDQGCNCPEISRSWSGDR